MTPMTGKPMWKPKPRALDKAEHDGQWQERDRKESLKVKARSRGQCEVTVGGVRCSRRAREIHHHIGGWKIRGRGDSALAANKTHACSTCHRLITGNVLVLVRGNRYQRVV